MSKTDWTLERDPQGPLRLTTADGQAHHGVLPVRAFPLAAPDEGLSLVGSDGHELLWIERLSTGVRLGLYHAGRLVPGAVHTPLALHLQAFARAVPARSRT